MSINRILKKVIKQLKPPIDRITDSFSIRDVILFESAPDYADNTKSVFDEMIRRGINKSNKLIWVCEKRENAKRFNKKFKKAENVHFTHIFSIKYQFYYRKIAKAFIVCNLFLLKAKDQQYYIDLAHGCALKNAAGTYSLPNNCQNADIITISKYMAPFDAHNLMMKPSCMVPLGYARNDDLFKPIDVHKVFADYNFKTIIYWLPTYRQNKWKDRFHSDISMPILYSENEARTLNDFAASHNALIVVKIHPAQDLSKIEEFNLSNIVFIKNDFFYDKSFTNYQLLGSCDAMISDYSSVYYDYLLCDKPIGLCFDDFEEYNKREGFTMDPNVILKGGEKLYNIDDLCRFVQSVVNGEDRLSNERNEIKYLVHDHIDNKSTERIVDYIEKKL